MACCKYTYSRLHHRDFPQNFHIPNNKTILCHTILYYTKLNYAILLLFSITTTTTIAITGRFLSLARVDGSLKKRGDGHKGIGFGALQAERQEPRPRRGKAQRLGGCRATYYTILYYTILYYTILYYTILYYTILYFTILYYIILLLMPEARTCGIPLKRDCLEVHRLRD